VFVFQDVDNAFPDESGFLAGVIKCIENTKIPIIVTSHREYEESEVIKRLQKKNLKVKNIQRIANDISAIKIKIRLHLIIIFEWIIKKNLQKYVAKDRRTKNKKNINFKIDWLKLAKAKIFNSKEINIQQNYISQLLKAFNFNLNKSLALISLYELEEIFKSIDLNNNSCAKFWKRKDVLYNENIFSTSNPNLKLWTLLFSNILDECISHSQVKKEEIDNEDLDSKEDSSSFQNQLFNQELTLEKYADFLDIQSELDSFHGRQFEKEEDISTRNICDINLMSGSAFQTPENQKALDEFWFGMK